MTQENISAGDVVQLKSGGPLMTVNRVYGSVNGVQVCECKWFEEASVKEGDFSMVSLKLNTAPV